MYNNRSSNMNDEVAFDIIEKAFISLYAIEGMIFIVLVIYEAYYYYTDNFDKSYTLGKAGDDANEFEKAITFYTSMFELLIMFAFGATFFNVMAISITTGIIVGINAIIVFEQWWIFMVIILLMLPPVIRFIKRRNK